jgi:hypothetical protein
MSPARSRILVARHMLIFSEVTSSRIKIERVTLEQKKTFVSIKANYSKLLASIPLESISNVKEERWKKFGLLRERCLMTSKFLHCSCLKNNE